MKSREKGLQALGSAPASPPSSSGGGGFTDAQFKDLKESILLQLKQDKVEEAASTSALDLMHVVESGLGYVAGKAVVGLMGKTTLEQKVDYLIHLLQQSLQMKPAAGNDSKPKVMKPAGMGNPNSKSLFSPLNSVPKMLQSKVAQPKPTSFGMGIQMPEEKAKPNSPTNPFFKDGSMM